MGSIIMSVAVVAIGVAIGLARGGRLDALRAVRPQWSGLLVGGFVLQALAENVSVPQPASLSVIGLFALVVGLVKNAPIRGALITAFGVTVNLVVLVINGAVPIRFEALKAAGLVDADLERSQVTSVGQVLELETADSRLASLGDTIPIGVLDSVISIGDLITFAGVIVIVSNLIAARRAVGVDVAGVFALDEPIEKAPTSELTDLRIDTDLAGMFGPPAEEGDVGVLDVGADDPVIDVSSPEPARTPVQAEAPSPIDLTFDPDDIWADDDGGVRVLGPSSNPNS